MIFAGAAYFPFLFLILFIKRYPTFEESENKRWSLARCVLSLSLSLLSSSSHASPPTSSSSCESAEEKRKKQKDEREKRTSGM
jgi:hypothetical protein